MGYKKVFRIAVEMYDLNITSEPFKAHLYKSGSALWILELHITTGTIRFVISAQR